MRVKIIWLVILLVTACKWYQDNGKEPFRTELKPETGIIVGRVIKENTYPVQGVKVELYRVGERGGYFSGCGCAPSKNPSPLLIPKVKPIATTVTDKDGMFIFKGINKKSYAYTLIASSPGDKLKAIHMLDYWREKGIYPCPDLVLKPTFTIKGKVTVETEEGKEKPVEDAFIYIEDTPFGTFTNKQGEYILKELPFRKGYCIICYKLTWYQNHKGEKGYYEYQKSRGVEGSKNQVINFSLYSYNELKEKVEIHYNRAEAFRCQGNFREAIREYQKVLKEETPLKPVSQYAIGECYFFLDEFERAEKEYRKLLQRYPNYPRVKSGGIHYDILRCYTARGDYPGAISYLRYMLTIFSTLKEKLDILEEIAEIYKNKLNNIPLALGIYKEMEELLLSSYPEKELNYYFFKIASFYCSEEIEEYHQAIALLRKYIGWSVDKRKIVEARIEIGEIYEDRLKEFEKAIKEYRYAVNLAFALYPNDIEYWEKEIPQYLFQIGELYERMRQFQEAIREYRRIISLFPHRAYGAHYRIFEVYYRYLGFYKKALWEAQLLVAKYPHSWESRDFLLWKIKQLSRDQDKDGYNYAEEHDAGTSDWDPDEYPGKGES